jgi:hypothetical protein
MRRRTDTGTDRPNVALDHDATLDVQPTHLLVPGRSGQQVGRHRTRRASPLGRNTATRAAPRPVLRDDEATRSRCLDPGWPMQGDQERSRSRLSRSFMRPNSTSYALLADSAMLIARCSSIFSSRLAAIDAGISSTCLTKLSTNSRYCSIGPSKYWASNSNRFLYSDGLVAPLILAAQSRNSSYDRMTFARCRLHPSCVRPTRRAVPSRRQCRITTAVRPRRPGRHRRPARVSAPTRFAARRTEAGISLPPRPEPCHVPGWCAMSLTKNYRIGIAGLSCVCRSIRD